MIPFILFDSISQLCFFFTFMFCDGDIYLTAKYSRFLPATDCRQQQERLSFISLKKIAILFHSKKLKIN